MVERTYRCICGYEGRRNDDHQCHRILEEQNYKAMLEAVMEDREFIFIKSLEADLARLRHFKVVLGETVIREIRKDLGRIWNVLKRLLNS